MFDRKHENIRILAKYFPDLLKDVLLNLDDVQAAHLCEIRIKSELPVKLVFVDETYYITRSARLTCFYSKDVIVFDESQVRKIFELMCNYSVYSLTDNIREGFITVENGCRVGIYGTAIREKGKVVSVRNICGLNVRVSGDYYGVSDKLVSIFRKNKTNVLVCGPPSSGKTTLLRDLCRNLSDELQYKVSVIDERFEFRNYYLGNNTDVLSGYPKAEGVRICIRSLSPEYIVFDELGSVEEVSAVADSINCGVNIVMSIHCSTKEELINKKHYRLLRQVNAIDYCAFLKDINHIPEILSVREISDAYSSIDDNRDSMLSCR